MSISTTISVIVVSHNYGAFLDEAIQSVLHQSRTPDEIIIIDDASTDHTPKIGTFYAEANERIRMIRNPVRLGVIHTYNKGVRATSGDLVLIMDADDRLSVNYLEELERELVTSGCEFAYAGEIFFGAVSGVRPVHPWDVRELAVKNYINTTALFKRSLFDAIGGFSQWFEHLGQEDWEFWLRAVANGAKGIPVETCWLEYRRHSRGSRGDLSYVKDLIAHLLIWLRLPRSVSLSDVIQRARDPYMRGSSHFHAWGQPSHGPESS
jgi:glycosyltransferase involved in cell wall biosynthesis